VEVESDSDMEPESEEDSSNPYPLEGKYINEEDRARLLQMSEIEREEALASRQEEIQRLQDKLNLDLMIKSQNGAVASDSVYQAAKRKHTARGATKEKSRKMDEYKARRKEKEDRVRIRKVKSPNERRRSSSSEPELSDVTDEEGEISKTEEDEKKFRDAFQSHSPKIEKPTKEDFEKLRISRHHIVKHYYKPWFEEWITGAWVRYLIGADETTGEPIYRVCEVKAVTPVGKPYKVNDITVDRLLELRHGKASKEFPLDKVSDSPFSQKEYDRIIRVLEDEKIDMPSRRAMDKKIEQLRELPNKPLTEADVSAMLARKNELNPANVAMSQAFNTRVRLTQEKNLALKRGDYKDAAEIEQQLQVLTAAQPERRKQTDSHAEILARVNERNRKANLEAVRKAEAEQAARKRQERKAMAAAAAAGVAPPMPHDVSARVKTVVKTHYLSRASTPQGTPKLTGSDSAARSVSPLPPLSAARTAGSIRPANGSLEARLIDSINIELGDF